MNDDVSIRSLIHSSSHMSCFHLHYDYGVLEVVRFDYV